jgi:hypothetical protein
VAIDVLAALGMSSSPTILYANLDAFSTSVEQLLNDDDGMGAGRRPG